ncbi:hypothetical protein ACGRPC_06065 [Vibrio diabolicus]|uniref:hypothetical protein n=1 Tax=Vibrio diabolicus TaxID=50719 RepID=UPI00374930B8
MIDQINTARVNYLLSLNKFLKSDPISRDSNRREMLKSKSHLESLEKAHKLTCLKAIDSLPTHSRLASAINYDC